MTRLFRSCTCKICGTVTRFGNIFPSDKECREHICDVCKFEKLQKEKDKYIEEGGRFLFLKHPICYRNLQINRNNGHLFCRTKDDYVNDKCPKKRNKGFIEWDCFLMKG